MKAKIKLINALHNSEVKLILNTAMPEFVLLYCLFHVVVRFQFINVFEHAVPTCSVFILKLTGQVCGSLYRFPIHSYRKLLIF